MAWNASLAQHFDWADRFGYHLNLAPSAMTAVAQVAVIDPDSPECVFAGDSGSPRVLHIPNEGGTFDAVANPNPRPFETVFLLFVDEVEAKSCLPDLWLNDPVDEEGWPR